LPNQLSNVNSGQADGFCCTKNSKTDPIIREIEQEGALVFAMQGGMVGAGSWTAGSKATATQKLRPKA